MAVRSKLARINNYCCEQVMPVPVIQTYVLNSNPPSPICKIPQNPEPTPATEDCPPYIPPPVYYPAAADPYQRGPPNYNINLYPLTYVPPAGIIVALNIKETPNTPDGYLLCDGTAILREDYPVLFGACGVFYGEGDGSTTFNIPLLANNNEDIKFIIKV
jgi:hypothetical protein